VVVANLGRRLVEGPALLLSIQAALVPLGPEHLGLPTASVPAFFLSPLERFLVAPETLLLPPESFLLAFASFLLVFAAVAFPDDCSEYHAYPFHNDCGSGDGSAGRL
jgi:hypothetical protein